MKEILFKKEESEWLKNLLSQSGQPMARKIIKKLERAEKKITTSSAKSKGRNLQYFVCERIANMFNIKFVQSDDNCLIQSRPMGQHGTDVILRGELYNMFPFDIECKCQETLNIPDWVRQAKMNTKEGRRWMVVFKKQTIGSNPLVIIDWKTFEDLAKQIKTFPII